MSDRHLASQQLSASAQTVVSKPFANLLTRAQRLLSLCGFMLCLFCAVVVVANQIPLTTTLDPFFRVSVPTLSLAIGFFTTLASARFGIICCLLLLPLLPDLAWQIQQHLGYGRIFASHAAGLDLIAGLLLGSIANQLRTGNLKNFRTHFPWPVGAVILLITCLLYTSPSPRDRQKSRMPSSA